MAASLKYVTGCGSDEFRCEAAAFERRGSRCRDMNGARGSNRLERDKN
jgi:hypothetical protein